jgi:hypothetical protein
MMRSARLDPNYAAVLSDSFADQAHTMIAGGEAWDVGQYLADELAVFTEGSGFGSEPKDRGPAKATELAVIFMMSTRLSNVMGLPR